MLNLSNLVEGIMIKIGKQRVGEKEMIKSNIGEDMEATKYIHPELTQNPWLPLG